ncbi:MAG TPA: nucleotidyltransferase domain-containing protein [Blastocatellia bacterium]|nr:nucleotidyltransferase domain-containing protein [Blastocatellia bacterium]HMY75509.1 nucleotidyltransferase domain-containing protein [Blastocatellia bacterium]HNG32929.1 nucleotidyltransferase domain-containing protein [Blastocatellia bacterium]
MKTELPSELPANVTKILTDFVASARQSFGDALCAVVLYGSAAEGRLRPTSDVNLLLVLSRFEQAQAAQLREPLRVGQTAVKLNVMFLLDSEIAAAAEAFAVKFADIQQRRQVLFGDDPFAGLKISRAAELARLKQSLLNLTLRWREAFVARGLREEQLAAVVAEAAGPLRACAAALLALEGAPAASPKAALEQIAASFRAGANAEALPARLTEARQTRLLPAGLAGTTLFQLIELAQAMQTRAASLS